MKQLICLVFVTILLLYQYSMSKQSENIKPIIKSYAMIYISLDGKSIRTLDGGVTWSKLDYELYSNFYVSNRKVNSKMVISQPEFFQDEIKINLEIDEDTYINIQLVDLFGNSWELMNKYIKKGKLNYIYQNSNLQSGFYLLYIRTNKHNYFKKILFNK